MGRLSYDGGWNIKKGGKEGDEIKARETTTVLLHKKRLFKISISSKSLFNKS